VTLELRADGGAVLSTDYLNGRPPVRSMGSWRIAPNGRVALVLRGAGGSGRIERIVFRAAGGALTAVEYDRGAWGRAGLVMRRVPASPPRAPLDGTRWEATQVAGVQPAELDRARPTLEFLRGEWRVAGSTGCNRAAGSYARSGATGLSFDPLATTRRACAEPADAVERAYLRALERTRRFASPSRTLVLYDGEGRLLARFRQTAR
jgi:heat shock protein HslJ